jgi:phenylalanyl-tRNA synthetase alpha chain
MVTEPDLLDLFYASLKQAPNIDALNKLKAAYLGKSGQITKLLKLVKEKNESERKAYASELNVIKTKITDACALKLYELEKNKISKDAVSSNYDPSIPFNHFKGSLHPITLTLRSINKFFIGNGFEVASGPEIEDDHYNFTFLNIPKDHPARAMHDTFYIGDKLLRTHTSPVQIRAIESKGVPIKVIAPGKVYRCDYDITHSPMFHQVEGLVIDKNINFTHLKGIIYTFMSDFFDRDIELRFRPSFFPFTEPSAEVDIKDVNGKWLEVLGCGLVHPNVLKNLSLDTDVYTGYAFGVGVERLAMLKYKINDLRFLYENDLRFLKQFR